MFWLNIISCSVLLVVIVLSAILAVGSEDDKMRDGGKSVFYAAILGLVLILIWG